MTKEEQRRVALERGNAIRLQCACLKRELRKDGSRERVAEVLMDPPGFAEKVKVFDLLLCVERVGEVKARAVLRRAGMGESWRVGNLSMRQRAALRAALMGEDVPVMWPTAA